MTHSDSESSRLFIKSSKSAYSAGSSDSIHWDDGALEVFEMEDAEEGV